MEMLISEPLGIGDRHLVVDLAARHTSTQVPRINTRQETERVHGWGKTHVVSAVCQNWVGTDLDQLLRLTHTEGHVRVAEETGELAVRQAAFGFREYPPNPHMGCYHRTVKDHLPAQANRWLAALDQASTPGFRENLDRLGDVRRFFVRVVEHDDDLVEIDARGSRAIRSGGSRRHPAPAPSPG